MSTRAKDSDRGDTCQVLDTALSEGQLSMEEHRTRVSAATHAATLGELQSLVSDLQTANAPVQLPTLKSPKRIPGGSWGIAAAALAVAVLLGMGIGWGLYGNTSSPLSFAADPSARPDGVEPVTATPPRQLHSVDGLDGLREQARKKFGDMMGYRLVVYPDYAVLDRADPRESRRELNYTYRSGWGDPSSSARTDTDALGELGAFDSTAVVGRLKGAPEALGIASADVTNTYLIVDPADDPTAPGSLTISVYVSSDYGSGYLQIDGQGNVKQVNAPS